MTVATTATQRMVAIPAGTFTMGSERFYSEEAPLRRVAVDGFWIDATPVTNRQFAAFVEATGHVTEAETAPDPVDYPGMPQDMARAGALVFQRTAKPVDTSQPEQWWQFVFGADWRHPLGPGLGIGELDLWDHPVVQVAYSDAEAFARWAGKDLPTEAEFEYASRGGSRARNTPGATNSRRAARCSRTIGRGCFPSQTSCSTDGSAPRPWGPIPPTAMASTT